MMGRIGGPLAGEVQHLAQHHVGEGGVVVVKECLDFPAHTSHQLTVGARVLHLNGIGCEQDGRIALGIDGGLEIKLAVGQGGEGDTGAAGSQQAGALVMEAIRTVGPDGAAVPVKDHTTGKEQNGGLLGLVLICIGVSGLHNQQTDIHLGAHIIYGGVQIRIVAPFEFRVLIQVSHDGSAPHRPVCVRIKDLALMAYSRGSALAGSCSASTRSQPW